MASHTIARLFDSYADASAAVGALEAAGFQRDDISLIARGSDATGTDADALAGDETGSGAGTGATLGTVVGGGAGLLAGIGALAIPGLGPIVAAGWLVAALAGAGVGAATGGLLGALTAAGVGDEHAHVYAEGVRRGGNLVTLRTDDSRAAEAEAILARHNAVDTQARATSYRSAGWTGYEEVIDPVTGVAVAAPPVSRTDAALASPPDGTPGNPPGTKLSRGVDDALGTNVSGARPENERGPRGRTPGV